MHHLKFGEKITRSRVAAIAFVDSFSLFHHLLFAQSQVEENFTKKNKQ